MNIYKEPLVSFLVLDFQKHLETSRCLRSIRQYAHFPHKIIYLKNGESDYDLSELADVSIVSNKNNGLGIGTRDLFAIAASRYCVYVQNDQYLNRPIGEGEINSLIEILNRPKIASVSLSGSPCGHSIYSERAHMMETNFYKMMESEIPLGYHGAGPYHEGEWRESQIQKFYVRHGLVHYTDNELVWFTDNGWSAIRENPDGSIWRHEPDTKRLWLLKGPVKERHVYPDLSDEEWSEVLRSGAWTDGKIPMREMRLSFIVPHWHQNER